MSLYKFPQNFYWEDSVSNFNKETLHVTLLFLI